MFGMSQSIDSEVERISSPSVDENIQGFNLAFLYLASELAILNESFAMECLGVGRSVARAIKNTPKKRLQLLSDEIRHFLFFKLGSNDWSRYHSMTYKIMPVDHRMVVSERAALESSVERLIGGFLSVALNLLDQNPKETILKYNLDDGILALYAENSAITMANVLSRDYANLNFRLYLDECALVRYLEADNSRERDLARLDIVSKWACS